MHGLTYKGRLIELNRPTQGRRRLLESGTAIEHRWCSPSADGTRGWGEDERGLTRKGELGDLSQENFVIQDD